MCTCVKQRVPILVSDFLSVHEPHLCVCMCVGVCLYVCLCVCLSICPLAGRCPAQHSWAPATGRVMEIEDFPLGPNVFFFLVLTFSITACNILKLKHMHMMNTHSYTKSCESCSLIVFGQVLDTLYNIHTVKYTT